jgi:hypothetical protein
MGLQSLLFKNEARDFVYAPYINKLRLNRAGPVCNKGFETIGVQML